MKYTVTTLDKIEKLLHETGYVIRYERGNFQSGYCILEEKKVLVLNKFLTLEGRINTLIDILPQLNFDPETLFTGKPEGFGKPVQTPELINGFQLFLRVEFSSLKISFLGSGTSSGVPMIACPCPVCHSSDKKDKRLRSSILIESSTTRIVVDTTPDFRYQMLRGHVNKLDAVLFTHPHKDHIAGLDDIRAFNFFSGKPMPVFANEMTQEVIIREFPYAFTDFRYPGVPEIQLNTIAVDPFMIGDIRVIPIQVWHLKMPVLGFRFGDFTYITDANRIEESEKQKILGSRILVLNALRIEKHISHFNLDEAVALARELGVSAAYFTHISHQLGKHADVMAGLPEGIELAYDGLTLKA